MTIKYKVQVKFLQKGDKLSSGVLIVTGPTYGVKTPKGKADIEVEYPNGVTKWQQWGKNTEVTVED